MNCKPGDLAIIVRSEFGNSGKIVTCLRLASYAEVPADMQWRDFPVWIVDRNIPGTCSSGPHIWDDYLRPIRPNDGEDEMIRIAGKPRETDVPNPQAA